MMPQPAVARAAPSPSRRARHPRRRFRVPITAYERRSSAHPPSGRRSSRTGAVHRPPPRGPRWCPLGADETGREGARTWCACDVSLAAQSRSPLRRVHRGSSRTRAHAVRPVSRDSDQTYCGGDDFLYKLNRLSSPLARSRS